MSNSDARRRSPTQFESEEMMATREQLKNYFRYLRKKGQKTTSFSAAAKRLGTSPQAISRMANELECDGFKTVKIRNKSGELSTPSCSVDLCDCD